MPVEGGDGQPAARTTQDDLLRELRAPRDPVFDDAAASGELLVARLRLGVLSFLLVIQLFPGWEPTIHRIGVALNLAALAWAGLALLLVARRYRPWIGFVVSAVDVSLVSAGLLFYVLAGRPHVAANSRILYEVYFLVIGCASLRYDWRACAFAGAIAIAQFGAVMALAESRWLEGAAADVYWGDFDWNFQAGRLVLLAAATAITTAVVLRGQRLRRLSATDLLTGLLNRGVFDARLSDELLAARRHDRRLAVALIDVDHFKLCNDRWGHAAGDEALRGLAAMLRGSLRASDVVARYGGEEFAILFKETGEPEARARLDQVREQVAGARLLPAGRGPLSLTFSAGVAGRPADGEDAKKLLAVADQRLYAAKAAGRNRIIGRGPEARPVPEARPRG